MDSVTRSGVCFRPVRSVVDDGLCSGYFELDGLRRARPRDPDYLQTLHRRGECRCVTCPSCTARVGPLEVLRSGVCWACGDAHQ